MSADAWVAAVVLGAVAVLALAYRLERRRLERTFTRRRLQDAARRFDGRPGDDPARRHHS